MYRSYRQDEKLGVVVIGASSFASLLSAYIKEFTEWEIVAYAVDKEYALDESFCGRPLLALEAVSEMYPPESFSAFVAVGYNQMSDIRKKLFMHTKSLGYQILSFIHPTALCYAKSMGEGNIMLEGSSVSMRCSVGDGNVLFNNCSIAHDVSVGDFNTFCAGSIVAGEVNIEDNCFLGIGSTVRNGVRLAPYTFIGMGERLNCSTKRGQAFIALEGARPHKMSSVKVMKFFELSE